MAGKTRPVKPDPSVGSLEKTTRSRLRVMTQEMWAVTPDINIEYMTLCHGDILGMHGKLGIVQYTLKEHLKNTTL